MLWTIRSYRDEDCDDGVLEEWYWTQEQKTRAAVRVVIGFVRDADELRKPHYKKLDGRHQCYTLSELIFDTTLPEKKVRAIGFFYSETVFVILYIGEKITDKENKGFGFYVGACPICQTRKHRVQSDLEKYTNECEI